MVNANDIFAWTPVYTSNRPYDFLTIAFDGAFDFPYDEKVDDFEERVYDHWQYDSSRSRKLSAIFYKGKPVAIMQFAGRKYSDHSKLYITNKEEYAELMAYLQKLMVIQNDTLDVLDPNERLHYLNHFYGDVTDNREGIGRPGFAITKE